MLDLTNQEGISIAVCRKLLREREELEVVVGFSSISVYTFWKGKVVNKESYLGFEIFQGENESGDECSEQEDDEEYSDPEDEMYDAMLSSDLFSAGYLDTDTGILMPLDGICWQ